jgi:hypothetical protein
MTARPSSPMAASFLSAAGLVVVLAGGLLLLGAETRLPGALLLATGATLYRASRYQRMARMLSVGGSEALVLARAWSKGATFRLGTATWILLGGVAGAGLVALGVLGRVRLAIFGLGFAALVLFDLAMGRWLDRQCQEIIHRAGG